jgi:pSer/pThr/pTyr-binding forkhead associated (FHA) protein
MAALVANNAQTPVSRIELRPGINTVGRAEGNHHVIPHGSVSSRHCEIILHDGTISVRDLGSTNGTFVEDRPAQQSTLFHGQRLKLGSIEFVLEAPECGAAKPGAIRVAVARPRASAAVESSPVGRTAADAIAAIAPVWEESPSFYRQIPGAFAYPFKRNGIILLGIGTVVFTILDFLSGFKMPGRGGFFSLTMTVVSTGYLFAYMQKIIAHTAQGEDELPEFPDFTDWWSDIILPFLLFTGTIVVSLVPIFIVGFWALENEAMALAIFPAAVIGGFYLPMALLAVAVTDNFLALSPHVVLPSILRVFLPYLLTFLLLGFLAGLRIGGGIASDLVPLTQIALKLLVTLAMGFASLYLLTVEMRLLGLLFRSYRARLGWL